jgi:hypothetical protein
MEVIMKKLMLLLAAASLAATASLNAAQSFGEPEIVGTMESNGRKVFKIVASTTSCCGEATYKIKLAAMEAKRKELQDAADTEYAGRSLLSKAGDVLSRRPVALGGKKTENMGVVASSDVSFKPVAPAMTVAPAEAPATVTPIPESRFSKVKTAAAVTAAGLIPVTLCPTFAYTAPYAEALWHAAKEKATAGVALATPYVQDAANYVATKAPVVATAIAASPYAIPAAYVAAAGAASYGAYKLGKYAVNKYVARKIAATDMEGTLSNAPAVASPSTDPVAQVGENITNPAEQQKAQADLTAMAKPSRSDQAKLAFRFGNNLKAFGRWIKAHKLEIGLTASGIALAAYAAWNLSMRSEMDNGTCGIQDMDDCKAPGFSSNDFLTQVTTCFKGTETTELARAKAAELARAKAAELARAKAAEFMEAAGAGFKYTPFAPLQKTIPGMIGTAARAFSRN